MTVPPDFLDRPGKSSGTREVVVTSNHRSARSERRVSGSEDGRGDANRLQDTEEGVEPAKIRDEGDVEEQEGEPDNQTSGRWKVRCNPFLVLPRRITKQLLNPNLQDVAVKRMNESNDLERVLGVSDLHYNKQGIGTQASAADTQGSGVFG